MIKAETEQPNKYKKEMYEWKIFGKSILLRDLLSRKTCKNRGGPAGRTVLDTMDGGGTVEEQQA